MASGLHSTLPQLAQLNPTPAEKFLQIMCRAWSLLPQNQYWIMENFVLIHKKIGDITIFRPSDACETLAYNRIKNSVFDKFDSGIYTDKKKVIAIVNFKYKEYYRILDEYLPKINPGSLFTFLCNEYERYGQVEEIFKKGELTPKDESFWQTNACFARRGIKHIMELLCIAEMQSNINVDMEEQHEAINLVFIAAEELASLYMRSDNYTHILPETTLRLDKNKYVYFDVAQDEATKFDIRPSVQNSQKYIPAPNFLQETLGVNYTDALGALSWIIDKYSNHDTPGKMGYCSRLEVVATIANAFSIQTEKAELIVDGFTLDAISMRNEGRELFKPKQQYRAYKRGFFRVPHDAGEMLIFSRRMAKECLSLLTTDVPFKKVPPEWASATIKKCLNELSSIAGRWFENVVQKNLEKVNIKGVLSVKQLIFKNGKRIHIPATVGEIDFLGICPRQNMLIVAEAKQVGFSSEPRMFLDDLTKFLSSSSNYHDKFESKYKWVLENHEIVTEYLSEKFELKNRPTSIGYIMITHYPMIISTFIKEFTCLSIVEFMQSYEKANYDWIFSKTEIVGKPRTDAVV